MARGISPTDLRGAVAARLDRILLQLREGLEGAPNALLAFPMGAEGSGERSAHDVIKASREAYAGPLLGRYVVTAGWAPMTIAEGIAQAERSRADVVDEVVDEIERCAGELVPPKLLPSVLARAEVAANWPWPEWATVLNLLTTGYWPGAAAPLEVARWARDGLNAIATRLREHDRPGDLLVADAERGTLPRTWTARVPEVGAPTVDELGRLTFTPPPVPEPPLRYPASGLALLFLAVREVEQSGRVAVVRVSANMASRAALSVLSAGTQAPWQDATWQDGCAELVWNGRPRPLQIRLNFPEVDVLDAALVRGILTELQEDGVRDWLTLHRMAAEQGATGTLRWTWAEHRERTSYERMIRSKNATDAELAAQVVGRLERMKGAELRWCMRADGKYAWARIGPFGLIDIPAGGGILTDAGRAERVAKVTINPAIYEGAARGSKAPHFALLPERALELPGPQLRLLAHLFLDFHYAAEAAGVSRKASTLWTYAGIRDGEATPRRRWPDAMRALNRALDAIGDAVGWDWSCELGESADTLYRIRPPNWWSDRVLRGVPADYGPSLASVPRTGAELRAWRTARGLSQRMVADLVGMSQPSIVRAEGGGDAPLSPKLATELARTLDTER